MAFQTKQACDPLEKHDPNMSKSKYLDLGTDVEDIGR